MRPTTPRVGPGTTLRVAPRPACPTCGEPGPVTHGGPQDRFYAVLGQCDLRRCGQAGCGTVWLDPCPVAEGIPKLYATYYAHGSRGTADPVGRVGPLRESALGPVLWLRAADRGRLLDVGCGSEVFLRTMTDLGWSVSGVEPHPAAAGIARAKGLRVVTGTIEAARFPAGAFDIVTMSHVLEHVTDPLGALRECGHVLAPGGRLIAVTPNALSHGARTFGAAWMGWDPPRHLVAFSPDSLRNTLTVAGLTGVRVGTLARSARITSRVSRQIRDHGSALNMHCGFQPGRVPIGVEKRNGAFFRWRRLTTTIRPPGRATSGGTRHGQGYQEVGAGAGD